MEKNQEGKTEEEKKILKVRNKQTKFQQHFRQGLTILIVVIVSIAFYFLLLRAGALSDYIWKIVGILRPVIYGVVIAYLLNPVLNFVERNLLKHVFSNMKNQTRAEKIARAAGVFVALLFGIGLVVALLLMLLPELFRSIRGMIYTVPRQLNTFVDWFLAWQNSDSEAGKILENIVTEATTVLENWLRTDLMGQVNVMMTSLTAGVISVVKGIMNLIIGIVVSAYILFSKEKFAGSSKKLTYALLGAERGNFLIFIVRKSHEIFGGFVSGKILDSAIIGVLCFISLTVLKMPYALLVSVIVGVTNVIPFFGPYIGAVPSAILIALASPIQGLYFLIFILVLQQIDGNVIGPKILGDSTGLSPFWIVVAILVGGGLFGFVGMVMGVPTLAVFFYIVNLFVDRKLKERKLPTELAIYNELEYIHVKTGGIHLRTEEKKGKKEKVSEPEEEKEEN